MSEFLAAIAGAVVGGVIAFAVQMFALSETRKQRTEDAKARQSALGHALVFKMMRLHGHFRLLNLQIQEALASARADGFRGQTWQIVLPTVNLPDPIHFTTDEMVMLLALKDNPLFNDLAEMDERHNTTIAGFSAYAEHRLKLGMMLPSDMHGSIGTAGLTQEQRRTIEPRMVEVNSIIEALIPQCQQQEKEAWSVLSRLTTLLSSKFGLTLKLELKRDDELRSTQLKDATASSGSIAS